MCVSPILIRNPSYGQHNIPLYKRTAWRTDTYSQFIYVPCGVCRECIALKQMYLIQRVQMEALDSFLYFSTLTYNNEFLPHYICPNGYKIPFADIVHLQNFFKRLRKKNSFGRPFRYLAVSERGKLNGRPHFHILWFLPRYEGEDYSDGFSLQRTLYDSIKGEWTVNLGSTRLPDYHPLFTFAQSWRDGKLFSNYDTHFVQPSVDSSGVSSVAFYVCKYLLKASDKERRLQQALRLNLAPCEYESAWDIVRSHSLRSTHFGLGFTDNQCSLRIVNYIRDCVKRSSGSPFPLFFSPDSNKTFPLSPYYKQKGFLFSEQDWLTFHMNDDSVFLDFNKDRTLCKTSFEQLARVQSLVEDNDISDLFPL